MINDSNTISATQNKAIWLDIWELLMNMINCHRGCVYIYTGGLLMFSVCLMLTFQFPASWLVVASPRWPLIGHMTNMVKLSPHVFNVYICWTVLWLADVTQYCPLIGCWRLTMINTRCQCVWPRGAGGARSGNHGVNITHRHINN